MVKVTRLDNSKLVINADMIELIQANPDTVITLMSKRKIVVKETIPELIEEVIAYRRKVFCWAANPSPVTEGSQETWT